MCNGIIFYMSRDQLSVTVLAVRMGSAHQNTSADAIRITQLNNNLDLCVDEQAPANFEKKRIKNLISQAEN